MGLKGNLDTVNLVEVFQVLARGGSSGLLRIQAPEGPRFVEIQNGAISVAGRSVERIMLGDLLLSRGLIDPKHLEEALLLQKETGKLLGQILIDRSHLSLENLEEALRFQVEEEVCELFLLRSGEFDFLANASLDARIAPGGGLVRLHLDTAGLLAEVARRTEEWKKLRERFPSQAMLFRLTPAGKEALSSSEGISVEGSILLRLAGAQRSIESMVHKTCLGRLTTNQMLIELLDAGLIELMPLAEYENAAREHLRLKRCDETARIVEYALAHVSPERQTGLKALLDEVGKTRKLLSQASSVKVVQDPRVRSEVIRRSQPNLILKQERAPWMAIVLVLVLLLAGGGGAAYYFLEASPQAASAIARTHFELMKGQVNELALAGKFGEALDTARAYKSHDPEIRKLATEHFEKIQKEFERFLLNLIGQFYAVYPGGAAEKVQASAEQLERYRNVPVQDSQVELQRAQALAKIDQYQTRQRIVQINAELETIRATAKGPDALEAAYAAVLAKNPPEEAAAGVREEAGKLFRARLDAARALNRARSLQSAGNTDLARMYCERTRQLRPASELAQQATMLMSELEKATVASQAQVQRLENLASHQKTDAARDGLLQFLQSNPPRPHRVRALQALQSLPDSTENESAAALRDALAKGDSKKLRDLVQKFPQSKALAAAVWPVPIRSHPAGAEVFLNGRSLGATPLQAPLPVAQYFDLTIRKDGFEAAEHSQFGLEDAAIEVVLERLPKLIRRLPAPAVKGVGVATHMLVAAGTGDLAVCSASDLKIQRRISLSAEAAEAGKAAAIKPQADIAVWREQAWVAACKSLVRVRLPSGEFDLFPLTSPATSGPCLFSPQEASDKTYAALATQGGLEILDTDDGKPVRRINLDSTAEKAPFGMARDGDMLYLPREAPPPAGLLIAMNGYSGIKKWPASLPAALAGTPAAHSKSRTVAALNVNGVLSVLNAETGAAVFQRDLKQPATLGCLALSDGYLAMGQRGHIELCAPKEDKVLWTADLPGEPVLPAVVLSAAESGPESALVVCISQSGEHFAYILAPDTGEVLWRAPLYSRAVAAAGNARVLYIATEDGDLAAYPLN